MLNINGDEIEIEEPKQRKPRAAKAETVTLKKVAFIDGELIGNEGAVIEVTKDIYDQLKASRII